MPLAEQLRNRIKRHEEERKLWEEHRICLTQELLRAKRDLQATEQRSQGEEGSAERARLAKELEAERQECDRLDHALKQETFAHALNSGTRS